MLLLCRTTMLSRNACLSPVCRAHDGLRSVPGDGASPLCLLCHHQCGFIPSLSLKRPSPGHVRLTCSRSDSLRPQLPDSLDEKWKEIIMGTLPILPTCRTSNLTIFIIHLLPSWSCFEKLVGIRILNCGLILLRWWPIWTCTFLLMGVMEYPPQPLSPQQLQPTARKKLIQALPIRMKTLIPHHQVPTSTCQTKRKRHAHHLYFHVHHLVLVQMMKKLVQGPNTIHDNCKHDSKNLIVMFTSLITIP